MFAQHDAHRVTALSAGVVLVAIALSGCASTEATPANQRGFFGGLGAAVTGSDQRRAARLDGDATVAEGRAEQLSARTVSAEREVAVTSGQVRAAEQRLAGIQGEVQRQRERLAALQRSGAPAAEATRISNELEAIDAERRSAAASTNTVSNATLKGLEDRAKAVNLALARLGAV